MSGFPKIILDGSRSYTIKHLKGWMPSWIAVLSTTKASVGHTMIKLAAKPSSASSCTGDNRTMKLLGGLSSLVPTKNEINTVRVHCLPNET